MSKLVDGRLLGFRFLFGDAKRTLHAAGDAAHGTSDNGADSSPNRACCLIPFPRPLACTLLRAADDTLTIRHDRHCQNGENARNNPSRFHVLSPRTNGNGTSLAENFLGARVKDVGAFLQKGAISAARRNLETAVRGSSEGAPVQAYVARAVFF